MIGRQLAVQGDHRLEPQGAWVVGELDKGGVAHGFDLAAQEGQRIHAIDLVRCIAAAEVEEVHSFARRAFSKYRDLHGALVVFANQCIAHFIFNYTTDRRLERYEIHGRDISAYLEGVNQGVVHCDGGRQELPGPDDGLGGTRGEDHHFIRCLLEDRPIEAPAPNLDEAVKTMELAEAIRAGLREE